MIFQFCRGSHLRITNRTFDRYVEENINNYVYYFMLLKSVMYLCDYLCDWIFFLGSFFKLSFLRAQFPQFVFCVKSMCQLLVYGFIWMFKCIESVRKLVFMWKRLCIQEFWSRLPVALMSYLILSLVKWR